MPEKVRPENKPKHPIDQAKLVSFLEEKWGKNRKCPMCGGGKWQITDRVFEVTEYVGNVLGPHRLHPVAPVTCENCGNTVLVNAAIAGVWTPPSSGAEEKEDSNE